MSPNIRHQVRADALANVLIAEAALNAEQLGIWKKRWLAETQNAFQAIEGHFKEFRNENFNM